jgi:hypothetical protein
MRFTKILLVCLGLALVPTLRGNQGSEAAALGNLPPNAIILADGGAPLPPPSLIADGGAPLPPPAAGSVGLATVA